jgi:hypothetical protein
MAVSNSTPTKNSTLELLTPQKAESSFSEFEFTNFQDLGGDLQTASMAYIALPSLNISPANDCSVIKPVSLTPRTIKICKTGRISTDIQDNNDYSLEVVADDDDEEGSILQIPGGLRVFDDF